MMAENACDARLSAKSVVYFNVFLKVLRYSFHWTSLRRGTV